MTQNVYMLKISTFYLNQYFFKKNGRIETHMQQLPQKNNPPPLVDETPPKVQQLFSPHLSIKKNRPLPI